MTTRAACLLLVGLFTSACVTEYENPFQLLQDTSPPPAAADLVFAMSPSTRISATERDIFALDVDGGGPPVRLTSCVTRLPMCDVLDIAPAPDRLRVAVRRRSDSNNDSSVGSNEEEGVFVMDLDRAIEGRILQTLRGFTSLQWTRIDSETLIFSATGEGGVEDSYFSSPNGATVENLTLSPGVRERQPRFEPGIITYERIVDGQRGEAWVAREGTPDAVLSAGDPSAPNTLLPGTPYLVGSDTDPDAAPDASAVVFRRLTGLGTDGRGTWDIYTIKPDGTGRQTIASGPTFRGIPDWGRAGIVFVEVADGAASLIHIKNDGTRQVLLSGASLSLQSPRWLP
jgi:hypothetical protein